MNIVFRHISCKRKHCLEDIDIKLVRFYVYIDECSSNFRHMFLFDISYLACYFLYYHCKYRHRRTGHIFFFGGGGGAESLFPNFNGTESDEAPPWLAPSEKI